ncbi:hypothetical protein [Streptomyces sp. NPDC049813]|uniref:hypothetical protein n=1 Tax=Streptomyces sp. NPDC049813 TaxID=3365597 RepID=UPI0037873CF8
MSILPRARRPLRPTVLTLALAAGLCLASPGVAAAADPGPTGEPATAGASPVTPGGPSWGLEQVQFAPDRIVFTDSASGFDDTGAAYFERTVLTVGGPDGAGYSVVRSHS